MDIEIFIFKVIIYVLIVAVVYLPKIIELIKGIKNEQHNKYLSATIMVLLTALLVITFVVGIPFDHSEFKSDFLIVIWLFISFSPAYPSIKKK